jgi:hypothetical protein
VPQEEDAQQSVAPVRAFLGLDSPPGAAPTAAVEPAAGATPAGAAGPATHTAPAIAASEPA